MYALSNALNLLNVEYSFIYKANRSLAVTKIDNVELYPTKTDNICSMTRIIELRGSIAAIKEALKTISELDD